MTAPFSVNTFTLSGFSNAYATGGYNASYTGGYFVIDPGNSDDQGSYDFNDGQSASPAIGSQLVSVSSTSNDAWKLSVTITSSTGSSDGIGYGDPNNVSSPYADAYGSDNHTLTFSGTGAVQMQTLIQGLQLVDNGSAGDTFGVTFDIVDGNGRLSGSQGTTESVFTSYFTAACYAAGTAIAGPAGEVLVEALRIGDMVMTTTGVAQPIKWIGRRTYSAMQLAAHKQLRPVLIRCGALANNMPHRDLIVSPMHGMFIDEVFVPAVALVNNVSIMRVDTLEPVSYIHIELADHGTIFAEGAPAETFVDDNSRMIFDNADEFYDMFGAEVSRGFSAPRLEEGYQLAAIRRRLELRAGATPAPVTAGPMQGHVERMTDSVVEGWVLDEAGRSAVELEVLVDGELFATVLANRYRMDLDHAGLAGGSCGFSVTMPASVTDLSQVEIRRAVDGTALAIPKIAALAV